MPIKYYHSCFVYKKRTGEKLWRVPRIVCGFGTSVKDLCPWLACYCLKTSLRQRGNSKSLVETCVKRHIYTWNTLLLSQQFAQTSLAEIRTSNMASACSENILQVAAEEFAFVRHACSLCYTQRSACMALLNTRGQRDVYQSEFWKGGKMTFITCQTINLWKSEGIEAILHWKAEINNLKC